MKNEDTARRLKKGSTSTEAPQPGPVTDPEQMNTPWLPESAWIFLVRWGEWLDIPQYG